MAIQFKKNCGVCKAIKADKKLAQRIYDSKYYIKGGEPLMHISQSAGLNYQALTNHVKKHQNLSEDALAEAQANLVAREAEKKQIAKLVRTGDVRQSIMDKLADELEKRDMSELTARDVIALLAKVSKDSDDVAAKQKDQDLDVFKMMSGVRSGANVGTLTFDDYDPWDEPIEGEVVEPR